MWLLEWLVNRYIIVQEWFSNQYWTWRDRIINLPNTVTTIYNNIVAYYNNAITAIGNKIQDFYYGTVVPIINSINSWVTGIQSKANSLWDSFWAWVADIPNKLTNLQNTIIAWARSIYDQAIYNLTTWINDLINSKIPDLYNKIATWLGLKPLIDALFNILSLDWLRDLKTAWDAAKNNLVTFASNPLGSILGFLWGVIIEFMCYRIAYSLGTTKYSLPNIPNWGSPATGGNITPPVSAGALGKPLQVLSISGYVFGAGHSGVDYGLANGDPVFASHDGVITFADWSTVGYGFCITLDGGIYWTRYAHLQSFNVSAGQNVSKGDVIGFGDSTGNSTGPHLHYELKINGSFVDPTNYL